MKMTHVPAWIAAAALPLASPAAAQSRSATDHRDARCAVAGVVLSKRTGLTAEQSAGINSFMMYYLGKLMGRHTVAQTRSILTAEERANPSLDVPAVAKDCAAEMTTVGTALQQ